MKDEIFVLPVFDGVVMDGIELYFIIYFLFFVLFCFFFCFVFSFVCFLFLFCFCVSFSFFFCCFSLLGTSLSGNSRVQFFTTLLSFFLGGVTSVLASKSNLHLVLPFVKLIFNYCYNLSLCCLGTYH